MKIENQRYSSGLSKQQMSIGEVYSRGDDTIRLYFLRYTNGVVNLSTGKSHGYGELEELGWCHEPNAQLVFK